MKSGNGGKWSWEEENILILCYAPERERVKVAIWKRISTTMVTRCLFLPLVIPSKLDPAKSGDKFWEPVHWTFTFGAVFWK